MLVYVGAINMRRVYRDTEQDELVSLVYADGTPVFDPAVREKHRKQAGLKPDELKAVPPTNDCEF